MSYRRLISLYVSDDVAGLVKRLMLLFIEFQDVNAHILCNQHSQCFGLLIIAKSVLHLPQTHKRFLYGILRGWESEKWVQFGWATGALATTFMTDYVQPADEEQVWSAWKGNARVKR